MTVVAVVLLAVAGVGGGIAWYLVERGRSRATMRTWLLAAAIPVTLVGAAAVFGLAGDPAGEALLTVARAAAVVAAITGGSLVATALLFVADPNEGVLDDDDTTGDASAHVSDPQTLRGGTSIGALERLGVAITLLAGWPEGVAVVLGIKGIGRYPALRRPVAAERFIIGSLASILWAACVVGVVYTIQP
ncbi:hypothetical protein [Jiangella alkaliphila]|uniref:Uncharacterized protein n=1 Tax=Jiangella alkaliphila TaxID=419479 RepID=A0A1H2IVP3_9ACTN|nr:hypothetical protein [Jiangella alkaliphila]SDU47946.1 hypothetical protein SAMN04488563_2035 [Jiangella alkaliphila]